VEWQERALGAGDGAERLDRLLEAVVETLGADRGCLILTHRDGSSSVIGGRAPERTLSVREREEVSKTLIAEALSSGRSVLLDPLGDVHSSVAELDIVCALAVPVREAGGGGTRGVLYVDVRERGKILADAHEALLEAAARLFALVLDEPAARDLAPPASGTGEGFAPDLDAVLDLPGLRPVAQAVRAWLHSDLPLLLTGESGVGKTVIATSVARALGRQPVVRATLGSSDDLNTITSELFGHERGAFSGAVGRREGLVELAHGGTLILDEVLSLPPHAQQLLLDFCQFGAYRPLGYAAPRPKRADVRLVAATNGDLEAAVAERRFREDLYYRLAGAPVRIPPLRERREDIPALTQRALDRADPERGWRLSVALRRALLDERLDWPGNVRQLEFVVRRMRANALAQDPDATGLDVPHFEAARPQRGPGGGGPGAPDGAEGSPSERWERLQRGREELDATEAAIIREALARRGGVVARAARDLGVQRTSLLSRMRTLGIEKPE
jgi:transcriptional regulator with GAF, ATPase, and Fis domain